MSMRKYPTEYKQSMSLSSQSSNRCTGWILVCRYEHGPCSRNGSFQSIADHCPSVFDWRAKSHQRFSGDVGWVRRSVHVRAEIEDPRHMEEEILSIVRFSDRNGENRKYFEGCRCSTECCLLLYLDWNLLAHMSSISLRVWNFFK